MKTIEELLTKLGACEEARNWAKGKTFEEIYTTCERGDWLNWLFARTNHEDVQLLTLVKGHQANSVRHLMRDKRSLNAVDTAIAFGEGSATKEELNKAARAAWAATIAEANAASFAASAAARAADYAAAFAASRAALAAEAAEQANQKLTAEIFRKYISIDKFKI